MLIQRAAWKTQPWKNGRGITHEIWRYKTSEGTTTVDDYDLRLSVAEIDGAQPFSLFAGYDRLLLPLADSPLQLEIGGQRTPIRKHTGIYFPGDIAVATVGEGHAIDLNVIQRQADCGSRVHATLAVTEPLRASPALWAATVTRPLAVFALEPCTLVGSVAGAPVTYSLKQFDTQIVLATPADLSSDVPVVWIRL